MPSTEFDPFSKMVACPSPTHPGMFEVQMRDRTGEVWLRSRAATVKKAMKQLGFYLDHVEEDRKAEPPVQVSGGGVQGVGSPA